MPPGCADPTSARPRWESGSAPAAPELPPLPIRSAGQLQLPHALHPHWSNPPADFPGFSLYLAGGGTGRSFSAVLTHLSPSSINMTGMSSTTGYLRPQSLQTNQASLRYVSSPPVVRTQLGQRRISMSVSLTIRSPFLP